MKQYTVNFIQNWTYTVEAEDEDKAYDLAHKEFLADMRKSVANTIFDDCEITCKDDEDEEDY